MEKKDFKKKFPDVCVQELEFPKVLSRKAIEDKVIQMVEFLETGLLGYEASLTSLFLQRPPVTGN